MQYVTSHSHTTSFADVFITMVLSGYFSLKSLDFLAVRFQTTRGLAFVPATPCEMSREAMPSPMIPRPINPIPEEDIFSRDVLVDFCGRENMVNVL